MKVGDLVKIINNPLRLKRELSGVIVGFNKKGEGGKDFVHVLIDGDVQILHAHDVDVIKAAVMDEEAMWRMWGDK